MPRLFFSFLFCLWQIGRAADDATAEHSRNECTGDCAATGAAMLQRHAPSKDSKVDAMVELENTEESGSQRIVVQERFAYRDGSGFEYTMKKECKQLKRGLKKKGKKNQMQGEAVQPIMLKMGCSEGPFVDNRGKGLNGAMCPFENGGDDGSRKCDGNPCWKKLLTADVQDFYNHECESDISPTPSPRSGPFAEPQCTTLVNHDMGSSDEGIEDHECTGCQALCTQTNKQKSVYLLWEFDPPLSQVNVFDIAHQVEWKHVSRLSEHGKNGLFQAFRFIMAKPSSDVKSFAGYTGPQVTAKTRTHLFSIWDTYNDPENPHRRLALPAADPGHCKRNCNDCGLHPGVYDTTGTQCKLPIDDYSGDASYLYRLQMSNPDASVTYNGEFYTGTEWEVTVAIDRGSSNETIVLGRVLLQGDTSTTGISTYKSFHEHLGCTACDAFYEQTIVTGPFMLEGHHKVVSGFVEPIASKYECRLHREYHLGGLAVSIETGPGVAGLDNLDGSTMLFDSCEYNANA